MPVRTDEPTTGDESAAALAGAGDAIAPDDAGADPGAGAEVIVGAGVPVGRAAPPTSWYPTRLSREVAGEPTSVDVTRVTRGILMYQRGTNHCPPASCWNSTRPVV